MERSYFVKGEYVYMLKSLKLGIYYKGYTTDPIQRFEAHQSGKSEFTAGKGPWELVFVMAFETQKEALQFEKKLKRGNKQYFERLIASERNLLNQMPPGHVSTS